MRELRLFIFSNVLVYVRLCVSVSVCDWVFCVCVFVRVSLCLRVFVGASKWAYLCACVRLSRQHCTVSSSTGAAAFKMYEV